MSTPLAAKSSNAFDVTLMMWPAMKGAPSAAPCSLSLMQHSHSSTAQPSKPVPRQFRENRTEIHLPVPERAEPSGTLRPWLKARIHPLAAGRIELRILDMKHPDALVVDVDVVQVVELLQHEVARIVENIAALVAVHTLQEHLERDPVVQVLTRMDLVTDVDPGFVEASRIGRQRRANSSNAVSTSPAGRCGHG